MAVFATGLTAVMFLLGMACTLHTFTLPQFSCRGKQIQLEIDFSVGPALGIIVLLITGCLPFSSLLSGLVGTGTLKPWVILIVFYGMAYLCVALDDTGLLKWLALKARNAAGNSGRRLFLYFFIFCSCLTLTTSNDVVILTMTPIIVYTANYARIDPIPYLYGQFFAANLWSMALYTGNPTNIIVAQALEYTFVGYLLWMVLPAIAAGLTCLCLLWFAFRHHIPEHISLDPVDTSGIITDRLDATVGGTLLMSCLAIVAFSNVLHAPIWVICLVFAGTALSFAFCRDARERYVHGPAPAPILRLPTAQAEEDDVALSPQDIVDAAPARRTWRRLRVVGRLPWKLLPFVVSLFVMVEALDYAGILPFCARLLGAAVSTPHPGPYAYLKAVLVRFQGLLPLLDPWFRLACCVPISEQSTYDRPLHKIVDASRVCTISW
eukprot:TRINITY_DN6217_c0_g1_i1.p1 TRINITY_DN6217_c0_g1~~TRINITY_DN6217_c0_g1_i1.p1  ORF type:complete len:436 (+),score=37.66 TRINITY_DN6217_c0_g1_i1:520-1827(+)